LGCLRDRPHEIPGSEATHDLGRRSAACRRISDRIVRPAPL